MANVLIVAYLLIVLALIAVILIQRSEGGGLGMGSSSGGLISVRGSANLLTRTTAILATLFFATAIGLTILSEIDRGSSGILERAADSVGTETTTPTNVLDALNSLDTPAAAAPAATTPASDPALALPSAAPATTDTPAAPAATETPVAPAATETPAAPATTDTPATTPAAPTN